MTAKTLTSLVFATALIAAPVQAQEVVADYEVEVLNLTVMKLTYSSNLASGVYGASMKASTTGVLGIFAEIKVDAATKGTVKDGRPAPLRFDLLRRKDGEERRINVSWNKAGVPTVPDNFSSDEAARLRDSFKRKSEDPLSVILKVGLSGDSPCAASYRAFDGRDAYDIAFAAEGGTLETGLDCRVRAKLLAGRDFEKYLQKGKGQLDFGYDVRLKSVDVGENKSLNVPTRVTGRLQGRKFTARLKSLRVNGQQLVN